MPVVTMPDGVNVSFPDEMAPEAIRSLILRKFPNAGDLAKQPAQTAGPDFREADPAQENPAVTQRAVEAANPMNEQGSAVDSAIKGATLGFGDEAAGAIGGALGWLGIGPESTFEGGYNRTVNNIRNRTKDYETRHPVAATVAEIAGSLPTLALPGGAALKAASLPGKVAASALTGAITGGAQGFGEGEGDFQNRLTGAERGAIAGGVLGAAVPVAGRAVSKVIGSRAGMKAVPTADAIENEAGALYKQAKEANLTVAPKPFAQAVQKIALTADEAGIDPGIHPKATAALGRLVEATKSGQPVPLQEVDKLRRVLRAAAGSMEPSEKFQAGKMIGQLDDFMNKLKPSDVNAADRLQAVATLKEARRLWSIHKKSDILEDVADRAKLNAEASGGSLDTALRREFKNLLRDKKRLAGFSRDEQIQIARMVKGYGLQNITRLLGKVAPSGVVSGAAGVGGGMAAFGRAGAVAVPAAGWAAKKASESLASRNANKLGAIIRNAGEKPFDQAAALAAEQKANLLVGTGGRAAVPFLLPAGSLAK